MKENTINQMQLFSDEHLQEPRNTIVKVIPNSTGQDRTGGYEFKKKIGLRLSDRIRQLETENHRLITLLEDFANDKLAQAQRIKELEHEKSNLKQLLANIISGNLNY